MDPRRPWACCAADHAHPASINPCAAVVCKARSRDGLPRTPHSMFSMPGRCTQQHPDLVKRAETANPAAGAHVRRLAPGTVYVGDCVQPTLHQHGIGQTCFHPDHPMLVNSFGQRCHGCNNLGSLSEACRTAVQSNDPLTTQHQNPTNQKQCSFKT
jgi:hypothetical protein